MVHGGLQVSEGERHVFSAWFLARYRTDSRGNRAKKDIPNGCEARHFTALVVGLVLCQRLHGSFLGSEQTTTEMCSAITVVKRSNIETFLLNLEYLNILMEKKWL
jgi:hypothetical protein